MEVLKKAVVIPKDDILEGSTRAALAKREELKAQEQRGAQHPDKPWLKYQQVLDKDRTYKLTDWAAWEDALVREHYAATGLRELSKLIDRTPQAIRVRAKKLGLKRLTFATTPQDIKDKVASYHLQVSAAQIGLDLGISQGHVWYIRRELGLALSRQGRQVRNERIMHLYKTGVPYLEIAEEMQVSVSRICILINQLRTGGEPLPIRRRSHIPWTHEMLEYIRANYPRLSAETIALNIEQTPKDVYLKLKELKIERTRSKTWTKKMTKYMRANYADAPMATLTKVLCKTPSQIYEKARREGLKRSDDFLTKLGRARYEAR